MVTKNGLIAIPPGETIKEQLSIREMSQIEFSERMGYSSKHISQLINGKVPLSHQTALKLESVFGIPARFWNNLEALYQEDLARIEQEFELEREKQIVSLIPYPDMAKKGWVKKTRKPHEKVSELRKFFEVASLSHLTSISKMATVFRKVDHGKASEYALIAWIQKGILTARSVETATFSRRKLSSIIPKLRHLINENPDVFQEDLFSELASCGVALVFLPHLKGTYAHGATIWPTKHKAIVIVSLRGKSADKFWFSFFHEIGHLLLHSKDDLFIHYDENELRDSIEQEADEYASNLLIPENAYDSFVSNEDFSAHAVISFAKNVSIPVGIVVGRLQHDRHISFKELNHLKIKYVWEEEQNQPYSQ